MTLAELIAKAKELYQFKMRGLPLLNYPLTRERLTQSRMRDLGTHERSIVDALQRGTSDRVHATELTHENAAVIKAHLESQGKKRGVVDSTLGTVDILRGLAREDGIVILERPTLMRPKRNRLNRPSGIRPRHYVKVARSIHVVDNSEYGLRYVDWPESLRREYEEGIEPFFTDPHAEKRSAKRPASPAYMKTWLNRAERAFGYLVLSGVLKEELSFRMLTSYETLFAYLKWLYKRRGNRHTMTTKGDMEQWRHLTASYYEDYVTGKRLSVLIRQRTEFETVKDKAELVMRVHADDMFAVFLALIAEAEHYHANVRRKYGRANVMALAAHKWMEAGIWGLTYVTWLREANIAMMTPRHFYRTEDGTWRFRFQRKEMKGKREHSDLVIDFWKGREGQLLLERVLDKVVELRPHLVERFRQANPGKHEPDQFFLNQKGRKYTCSALRHFYNSASVRYLGEDKRLTFHDVRAIVPSWLFVREGEHIVPAVQRRLDHAHIKTTQDFYLKIEKLFDSRLVQARIEERAKQKKAQERLANMPDEIAAMLERFKEEIITAQTTNGHHDPGMFQRILLAIEGTGASGLSPTLPPREVDNPNSHPKR